MVVLIAVLRGMLVIYEPPGGLSPMVRQMLLGLVLMFIGGLILTAVSL